MDLLCIVSRRLLKILNYPWSSFSMAGQLRERVELGPGQLFRLVGVGLSNFQIDSESTSPHFGETASEEVAAVSASNE
jgi:DNA polymerase IV